MLVDHNRTNREATSPQCQESGTQMSQHRWVLQVLWLLAHASIKMFANCLFFFLFTYYLFLAVLGPRFCARAFSSCSKRGPLFIAMRGPLTIAASLVAGHRLQTRRLSSCGSRAQLLRSMWDLPRPGLEPVSPALAGRFSTTAPPGKPLLIVLFYFTLDLLCLHILHMQSNLIYIMNCFSITSIACICDFIFQ